MSYVRRLVRYTFVLQNGSFSDSGLNQLTISGLRCTNKIIKAGGASMGRLQAAIYGMTLSQMKQLSTLGMKIQLVQFNRIIVEAGDTNSGYSKVFDGTISYAVPNLEAQPQGAMTFIAMEGYGQAVQKAEPTSFNGGVDVQTVMAGYAKQAGLTFEPNGVSVQIPKTYYSGSLRDQMAACARDADVNFGIDNGVLWLTAKDGSRSGAIPDINVDSSMIDYPSFTAQGISVKTVFNPAIRFMGKVQITSLLVPKSIWAVTTLEHNLDSLVPHGNWQSILGCYNPNYTVPVTR